MTEYAIAEYWRPLVKAAGMHSSSHRPAHTYMLACCICADPVVKARTPAQHPMPDYPALTDFDYEATLKAMTPTEKQELAERVKAKWRK